jgi:ABC-type molybdate transport system substrate-binding protein
MAGGAGRGCAAGHARAGTNTSAVGRGEVEIGVSQATEIVTQLSVQFIGFMPDPYQAWTLYQAAALTDREGARLFVRALQSPPAVAVLKRAGFE